MNWLTEDNVDIHEADFRRISTVIYEHCGINLHDGKKALVRARLAKRMRETGVSAVSEYLDYALNNETEFYHLVDSISTNLTSFFREKMHFDYLRDHFLPAVTARKQKQNSKRLRFWSAGCSSGEEPYTLAIVLQDYFAPMPGWDIKILATDVSTRMLEQAARGLFDEARIRPLSGQQKSQFFTVNRYQDNKFYETRPELKKMISFRYLNLMESWPFHGPFDAIFCRNVMIYFDKPTQEKLVSRYFNCLDKNGILFIGHSESLTGVNHSYRYVQPATYQKP